MAVLLEMRSAIWCGVRTSLGTTSTRAPSSQLPLMLIDQMALVETLMSFRTVEGSSPTTDATKLRTTSSQASGSTMSRPCATLMNALGAPTSPTSSTSEHLKSNLSRKSLPRNSVIPSDASHLRGLTWNMLTLMRWPVRLSLLRRWARWVALAILAISKRSGSNPRSSKSDALRSVRPLPGFLKK